MGVPPGSPKPTTISPRFGRVGVRYGIPSGVTGSAILEAVGTIVATAVLTVTASASLSASADIVASAVVTKTASSSLSASADILATPQLGLTGSASLDGIGDIQATAFVTQFGVASLSAIGQIVATPAESGSLFASASISGIAELLATAEVPCPCPEWSVDATLLNTFKSDQTLVNSFTQKAEQSTNRWRKKNCE